MARLGVCHKGLNTRPHNSNNARESGKALYFYKGVDELKQASYTKNK